MTISLVFDTFAHRIHLKLLFLFAIFIIICSVNSSSVNVIGQKDDEPLQATEICDNGVDDDADGSVDGKDEDCSPPSKGEEKQQAEEQQQEQQQPVVEQEQQQPAVEVCDNGVDDNGNGLVDNQDAECTSTSKQITPTEQPGLEGQSSQEICDNGVDDNGVGAVDGQHEGCLPQGHEEQKQPQGNDGQSCTDNVTDCISNGKLSTEKSENAHCPNNGNKTDCITTGELSTDNPQCPNNGNATDCQTPNLAPIASAGNMQEVSTNQSVSLNGLGSYDPDGNITSFHWAQTAGQPSVKLQDSDKIQSTFIAPIVSNDSLLTFELTVQDDKGLTDTDSVDISVNTSTSSDTTSENFQPISDLKQRDAYEKMLDASLVDSDSQKSFGLKLLSYTVNGSEIDVAKLDNTIDFSLNGSSKVSVDPTNSSIQIEVTDMTLVGDDGTSNYLNKPDGTQWELDSPKGPHSLIIDAKYAPGGGHAHYGANIQVVQKETLPPIADAGQDQVVEGNATVTLDGTKSSDPDGAIASYQWLQINEEPFISVGGIDTPKPTFISPSNLGKDTNMTFRLIVTDNDGANDTDDVSILIKNISLPKVEGNITLDPVPSTISAGQFYEFKGTLNLTTIPDGAFIQIRSGEGKKTDQIITFGDVDNNGRFKAGWTAEPRKEIYNIYASYEDVSGNIFQSEAFPLQVTDTIPNSRVSTQDYSNYASGTGVCNEKPCIENFFNDWKKDFLNLYIIANDPFSVTYLDDAEKAVKDLTKKLQHKTGTNKWNFKIFPFIGPPSDLQIATHPWNIVINLRENNGQDECGHSDVRQRKSGEFIMNDVLPACGKTVDHSTKHELIHSLGIGHTWNEGETSKPSGDMMCSVEWYPKQGPPTCRNAVDNYIDTDTPTEFDMRAIISAYGNNGFEPPNNGTIEKQSTADEQYSPLKNAKYFCTPLPCVSSTNRFTDIDKKIDNGGNNEYKGKRTFDNHDQFVKKTENGKTDTSIKNKVDTQVKKNTRADKTESISSTFHSYRYNKLGISLEHPLDWNFSSLKNGIQLIKEKNGVYVEIRKHNLESPDMQLKQYVGDDIKDRSSSREDFKLLNITKTTISGNLPAYKAIYTFLETQNQKDFTAEGTTNKILRIWTFAQNNAYTVAYVADEDKYDLYLPIAEKIIDSLKINTQEKSLSTQ